MKIGKRVPAWRSGPLDAIVAIYELAREFDYWTWLCGAHLRRRLVDNWQIRESHAPLFALTCDDCHHGIPT